jgi:hypothetical protein
MKTKFYTFILIPFSSVVLGSAMPAKPASLPVLRLRYNDTAHYWTLKANVDPHVEAVRINPENYEDNGAIAPPSGNDPCNTGYDELCGIYVIPDPGNKKQPGFSKTFNSDIYQALKKNQYLEGKVFFKDL